MMQHPTGNKPQRVALIAAGPSKAEWTDILSATGVEGPSVDEVWGINGVGRSIRVDVTFMMDDYAAQRAHLPTKAQWFETAGHPIITSTPRPNCPTAHAYPLGDVLKLPGALDYLNHTVPYVIAYAIVLGVKELLIFGADYVASGAHYDNSGKHNNRPVAGRYMGCTSFWLGVAAARGMDIIVGGRSPLLDSDVPTLERFYGYLIKPVIRRSSVEPSQPKQRAEQ
jgi:hypothetical protein